MSSWYVAALQQPTIGSQWTIYESFIMVFVSDGSERVSNPLEPQELVFKGVKLS